MDELSRTLDAMDSTRLLLALMFVAGYACAIGGLASGSGRRASVLLAVLAGLGFVGLTDPWAHGALLVAFVVVGIGTFIALSWAFSAWATRAQSAMAPALALTASEAAAIETSPALGIRRVRRVRRRYSPL